MDKQWESISQRLVGVKLLAEDGATLKMIARYLGVSVFTLKRYRELYPELEEAINEGRSKVVENLESRMYQRAMGVYEIDSRKQVEKIIVDEIEDEETGQIKQVQKKRTIVTRVTDSGFDSTKSDTNAARFLLEQYAPERFQRKGEEVTGFEPVSIVDTVCEEDATPRLFYDDTQDEVTEDDA